jgi:hypothetical protein
LLQRLKELAERDFILGAVVNWADLCAPPYPDHRRREGGLPRARRFRPEALSDRASHCSDIFAKW